MIWFPSGRLPQHRKAVLRNDINLSATCPKGKYHCESNITAEGNFTAQQLCFLGTPRDTVYPWGKGANKQKTNKQMQCVCLVKSTVCD